MRFAVAVAENQETLKLQKYDAMLCTCECPKNSQTAI